MKQNEIKVAPLGTFGTVSIAERSNDSFTRKYPSLTILTPSDKYVEDGVERKLEAQEIKLGADQVHALANFLDAYYSDSL